MIGMEVFGIKLSNKVGVSTNSYHGFDLDAALKGTAAAGFEYVELTAVKGYTEHVDTEKMTDREIRLLLDNMEGLGLKPLSLSGHSDLTSADGVDLLKKNIQFAKKIGVDIVNTGPGEVEVESKFNNFKKYLKDVAGYAAQEGVVVALETHGPVLGTGEAMARLVEEVDSPQIRVNYDTGNVIMYGGVKPEEDIAKALLYTSHIHLKDQRGGKGVWDFPAIGDGEIAFEAIFKILQDQGYRGPLSVEVEITATQHPEWLVPEGAVSGETPKAQEIPVEVVDEAIVRSMDYLKRYFPL